MRQWVFDCLTDKIAEYGTNVYGNAFLKSCDELKPKVPYHVFAEWCQHDLDYICARIMEWNNENIQS